MNLHNSKIAIKVEQHVRDKMQGWCDAANSEVSGWFLVKPQDSSFYVYDVFLPEQKCSSGYTKIDGYATGRLYGYLRRKYGLDGMTSMKGWWHTHYNFGVGWSGTDNNQIKSTLELAEDYTVSIVINQAGDWLGRFDTLIPIRATIDEIPLIFVQNSKSHAKRDYMRDIKRWVSPLHQRKVIVQPRSILWDLGGNGEPYVTEQEDLFSYENKTIAA